MKHLKIFEDLGRLPGLGLGDKVESWVNVKIDKDLPLRISRYAQSLDQYVHKTDLKGKLEILSNPLNGKIEYGIQCQLAIMMILQYLKEIKSNFDPSSSGFLFEDFIAGLLHGQRKGGYGNADFVDKNGLDYQIKFYGLNSPPIKVRAELCSRYIIGLKDENMVYLWIIDDESGIDMDDYVTPYYYKDEDGNLTEEIAFRKISLSKLKKQTRIKPYKLEIGDVEKDIKEIAYAIRTLIEAMYDEMSELNYNIETIITGIDKNRNPVDINKIQNYYDDAVDNMKGIKKHLEIVRKGIFSKITSKFK